MRIDLINQHPGARPDEAGLRQGLELILRGLKCPDASELSVLLVDDERIAELNLRHMNRKGPTNVLSFPMDAAAGLPAEPPTNAPFLLGDVVVSLDTTAREARENGLDPDGHLMRLLIHGVLHLLGHDHLASEDQARDMEDLTEQLLAHTGYGRQED